MLLLAADISDGGTPLTEVRCHSCRLASSLMLNVLRERRERSDMAVERPESDSRYPEDSGEENWPRECPQSTGELETREIPLVGQPWTLRVTFSPEVKRTSSRTMVLDFRREDESERMHHSKSAAKNVCHALPSRRGARDRSSTSTQTSQYEKSSQT